VLCFFLNKVKRRLLITSYVFPSQSEILNKHLKDIDETKFFDKHLKKVQVQYRVIKESLNK
jgi:hypothetical protein